jgi:hypothetical protein
MPKSEPVGQLYHLNGEWVDEEEISLLIRVSESRDRDFNFSKSFMSMFYHILTFTLTPFIAVPLIWVLEGFDTNLLHNMLFLKVEPTMII